MKSIMEEASSISKAIDQAWSRAGKPAEFTIKILEHPERNMFGLTTKSAKIAFFFDERKVATVAQMPVAQEQKPRPVQHPVRHEEQRPRPQQGQQQRPVERPRQPQAQAPQRAEQQQPRPATHEQQEPRQPRWSDEMVATATEWITQTLSLIDKSSITFTTAVSGNSITFQFSQSITGDQGKDRLLFSGFANVIMATLRTKYKKSFRFNKVILIVA